MLSIFSCLLPSVCLLWRNVCLVLWPIFWLGRFIFLELSCRSCLYIFEINSLSIASFTIIFSHSEGCLFSPYILFVFFPIFRWQKISAILTWQNSCCYNVVSWEYLIISKKQWLYFRHLFFDDNLIFIWFIQFNGWKQWKIIWHQIGKHIIMSISFNLILFLSP